MKNLKLKKVKYCTICGSSDLKNISEVKNELTISRIKTKLLLIECKSCLHRTFSKLPSNSQLTKAYINDDPLVWGLEQNEPHTYPKRNNNYNFSKIKPLYNHWIFKHINIDKKKIILSWVLVHLIFIKPFIIKDGSVVALNQTHL